MNRVAKQLLYGTAYLIILALIAFGIYSAWFGSAITSSSCESCVVDKVNILTNPIALQSGQDQSIVLAALGNDSGDYSVDFSYKMVVHDIIGGQIDAFNGTSSIPAAGMRYILFTGIASNAINIGTINFEITDTVWVAPTETPQYNLSLNNVGTYISQNGGYINGTVTNEATSSANNIDLLAILHDFSGKIVGASVANVGDLPALGKTAFEITLPVMDTRTANSIDKSKTEVSYEVIKD